MAIMISTKNRNYIRDRFSFKLLVNNFRNFLVKHVSDLSLIVYDELRCRVGDYFAGDYRDIIVAHQTVNLEL